MSDPLPDPVPELRSEPDTVLALTEVAHGGGLYDGQGVFFDARTAGGETVRVVLPHTHVSAFIAQLVAFAGEAKKVRDEREEQSGDDDQGGDSEARTDANVEYTQMLNFQGIQISPLADLSGVAFQFIVMNENKRCSILFHLLVPGGHQSTGQLREALADPAQRRHRIAARARLHHRH